MHENENERLHKIYDHPRFQELVSKKSSFCNLLSIVVLAAYFGFILVIAFDPKLLAVKIAEGSVVSWGIPAGLGLIFLSFLLTGVYTLRANGEFDRLTKEVVDEVQQ